MTWFIELVPAAEAEMVDAAVWYEERRAQLGGEFLAEVRRCFSSLLEEGDVGSWAPHVPRRVGARRIRVPDSRIKSSSWSGRRCGATSGDDESRRFRRPGPERRSPPEPRLEGASLIHSRCSQPTRDSGALSGATTTSAFGRRERFT